MTSSSPAPSTVFRGGLVLLVLWVVLALPSFVVDRGVHLGWALFAGLTAVGVIVPRVGELVLAALRKPSAKVFVIGCAVIAAAISLAIVLGPMRDRPSSIDAHVYVFQARALSHGHIGMPLPEPQQLFGGRFLFAREGRLYGVFPPGFPLFLAPFVMLSATMLAGPVIAALLVFAQWMLGRAIEGEDGVATRIAILISLPSLGRAVETADLLSHAFVAVLGAIAIALSIEEARPRPGGRGSLDEESPPRPDGRGPLKLLIVGACLGWATISRLLDGVMFCGLVAVILGLRVPFRRAMLPLLTFLPFLAVLLLAQRAATGSFVVPTQSLYFARSDYPATCHRLGFGWDVGCAAEHMEERASFGADGYTLDDAVRVVRERARLLGSDLFGFAPIGLLGFGVVVVRKRRSDAFLAASIVAFTLGYGLFYYGNAPVFGARHLFPIAPLFWLLVARAMNERAALILPALVAGAFVGAPRWMFSTGIMERDAQHRVDVRSVIEKSQISRGLVVTADDLSNVAAFDPYRDGPDRIVVRFDGSGLKDLRRLRPDLPVHAVLEGDVLQTQMLPAPPPGVQLEIERVWPSSMFPNGLGARVVNAKSCCNMDASGERVLFVFAARQGATLTIPFTVARAGRFALRVDGLVAPDYGTWSVPVDDHPLPDWDGYAPAIAHKQGTPSAPIDLSSGPHTLTFTCTGKRAESRGMLASFDVLIGTP